MTDTNKKVLTNCTILLTRPQGQNAPLCEKIKNYGGNCLCLPTIEILPPQNIAAMQAYCRQWHTFDIAIFLSANAARQATPYLSERSQNHTVIAIGPGTAQALTEQQLQVSAIPHHYSSEGLLELDSLQSIKGKKILIFCGENPRPHLKKELQNRGATIKLALCYRRRCPKELALPLDALQSQHLDIIVTTSMETLTNLYAMIAEKNRSWLNQQTLLVIKPSMLQWAKQQAEHRNVIVSPDASAEAILNTLINWYTKQKSL